MKLNNKKANIVILGLVFLMSTMIGCTSLPKTKLPSKNLNPNEIATISFARIKGVGIPPSIGGDSVIAFGRKFAFPVLDEWETGSLFGGYKFNDKAKVVIPAGKYALKLYWNYQMGDKMMVKTAPYEFEAGKKYKVHFMISYFMGTFKARISRIEEIKK